jgi:hypothetical protein
MNYAEVVVFFKTLTHSGGFFLLHMHEMWYFCNYLHFALHLSPEILSDAAQRKVQQD